MLGLTGFTRAITHRLPCVGQRTCSALASAAPSNWVRFVSPDGSAHWGTLAESDGEARYANVVEDVLAAKPVPTGQRLEIKQVLAPLPVDPAPAIVVIGLNYRSHANETGQDIPRNPVFAYKSPASAIGHQVPISIPSVARQKPEVDFEGELAIVIGQRVCNASPEEALKAILGVTGANDVSARRWQGKKGGGQWSRAKSFDTFCPLGPSLLPLDSAFGAGKALAADGPGLRIRSIVNGNIMQDAHTSDMIFTIGAVVSYLSQGTTLLPGTVILTGTPPGVGYVRKPPVYLAEGDVVEVELEGAGKLSNTVENGP